MHTETTPNVSETSAVGNHHRENYSFPLDYMPNNTAGVGAAEEHPSLPDTPPLHRYTPWFTDLYGKLLLLYM